MFSLMWTEHCAYKHSQASCCARCRPRARACVMGPGENAGAVDVGDGLACAFKVESHNHPSAVEPFQGAATGVGGILRDVFAIGARPIAVLDSLRFGEPEPRSARATCSTARSPASATTATRSACRRSAARSTSRRPYEQNCLVNAMCVGLIATRAADPQRGGGRRQRARAARRRAPAATGSAARRCWPPPSSARPTRPSARRCRSATRSRRRSCSSAAWSCSSAGCSSSLQDLGAAGLTSSAAEMASKGEVGHRHRRARACRCARRTWSRSRSWSPSRRSGCSASSSPTRLDEVLAVCARWEVRATAIGEVTDTRPPARARRRRGGRRHAGRGAGRRLPALRPRARARRPRRSTRRRRRVLTPAPTPAETLLALLGVAEHRLAALGVRAVRLRSSVAHRAPARAGRRRGARASPRRPRRDRRVDRRQRPPRGLRPVPRRGRGRARVRGQPRLRRRRAARADQLPELRQPGEAAHRLAAHARGRAAWPTPAARSACRSSAATSRSTTRAREGPIYPTPVVGMVGELPDARARRPARLRARRATRSRSSAAVARRRWPAPSWPSCAASRSPDGLPAVDLGERRARCTPRSATPCARARCASAHDIAEGGLAVALAECCLAGGLGARSTSAARRPRGRAVRRGPGRVRRLRPGAVAARARRRGGVIGEVGGDALAIDGVLTVPVGELSAAHAGGLARCSTSAQLRLEERGRPVWPHRLPWALTPGRTRREIRPARPTPTSRR